MALLALIVLAVCFAEYLHRFNRPIQVVIEVCALAGLVLATTYALGYGIAVAWLVFVVGLWWASARTLASWRVPAMVAVAIAAVLAVVASPQISRSHPPIANWYESLDFPSLAGVGLDSFALAIAVLVFQLGPANAIVRVVLDNVGRGLLAQERRLKGGRVIGPLERVLVFGLAVSGNIGGVAAILAAKGILRFPEINRDEGDGSGAEYVLVGSFVSWFIALAFVPFF